MMISPNLKQFVNLQRITVFLGLGLLLSGCATSGGPSTGHPRLPPGYYIFDMPVLYEKGLSRLEDVPGGVRVQLLETFQGRFELHGHGEKGLVIRKDEISYPGLRRTFSGEGTVTGPGTAGGEGTVWIRLAGPLGRDHRTGAWTLRPATRQEIDRHERTQRSLEARRRRAGLEE